MSKIENQIIGTWELVQFSLKNLTNGQSLAPYGKSPIGTLLFSTDGYMSVAIMEEGRVNFLKESLLAGSTEEKVRALETYLSYSGLWKIVDDKIFVDVKVSLLPNWTGVEHFRTFQLDDNILTFQTPVIKQGENEVMAELSWKRVGTDAKK